MVGYCTNGPGYGVREGVWFSLIADQNRHWETGVLSILDEQLHQAIDCTRSLSSLNRSILHP